MPAYALHPMFSFGAIRLLEPSTETAETGDTAQPQELLALKPISALSEAERVQALATIRQQGGALEDSETASLL